MKKPILFLMVGLQIISINLFSQKKVEVGFYVGTSVSNMSGVDYLEAAMTDALTQVAGKDFPVSKSIRSFLFNGGGFLTYNFSHSFALKGGIEYAPKGEKFSGELYLTTNSYNYTSEVVLFNSTLNMAYVEFPISFQFSTRKKDFPNRTFYYLNTGIAPAIKVLSKQDVSVRMVERGFNNSGVNDKPIGESQNDSNELEGLRSADLGAFCSIGVCNNPWFVDIKYGKGLKNILENTNEGDIKNNLLVMCLGYKF
jgi:hypothetical protein